MTKQANYTVITGASSGIGRETAKAFAKRGKNIIAIARRENRLSELRNEIQNISPTIDVVVKTADLSDIAQVYRVYEELRGYPLETWVNNAGLGNYDSVSEQDLSKIERMLRLDIAALTIFSTLFVRDYENIEGTQLINISSAGGYTLVPNAVTYCAAKFYVSAFTEGLARELIMSGAEMRAKVLAPAATKTEFGMAANDAKEYNYDEQFGTYNTSEQAADFLMRLYDSEKTVGTVNRETFEFELSEPIFPYAGNSRHNQKG